MQSLIEERVKQEVLYREAVAMGLDQGDEIVKRRMAQKMEFLAEDLSDMKEPTESDLHAYFNQHQDEFRTAGRITFRHHLLFARHTGKPGPRRCRRRGETADRQATGMAGSRPPGRPVHVPGSVCGSVARAGRGGLRWRVCARGVSLPPGIWSGPVESGLGWHLVAVEELRPPEVPSFESVEPDVKMAWIAARRAEYQKESYAAMRAKYTVELPNGVSLDSVSAGTGASPRRIGL